MNAILPHFLRRTGLLAGAVLFFAGAQSRGADQPLPADAFPVFDSYIKISGQAPSISGNKAAYQERMHDADNGSGGIEDLHIGKDLSKDVNLTVDGHALFGAADYLGQFKVTKNEVGSFEAGYKSFRTFYDDIGGFFPLNQQWFGMANESLHTDRSKLWITGTINLPNLPVITLSYINELRDGQKDSTIWGTTDLTGLPFTVAPNLVSESRRFVPSYLQLNERHEAFEGSIKHTIGNTTFQLNLLNDTTNNLDSRYVTLFPGQSIPWSIAKLSNTVPQTSTTGLSPLAVAKSAAPYTSWNNQVLQTQSDGNASTTRSITGKIDTVLNDKLTFHIGASYQDLDSDMTGNRTLVTTTPTATAIVPVTTAPVSGLTGTSAVKILTGNFVIDYKPINDLFIKVGIRAENEDIKGASNYNVIAASGTPATTLTTTPRVDFANINQHSTTPVVELRYTGIKNLAFYFTGSKRSLDGTENNTSSYNPLTATAGTLANNNLMEDHGDYTLGANWQACTAASLRAEVFSKHHQFESGGYGVNLGDYYLLDTQMKGMKITGIVKPLAELTSTTRYIYQTGKMQVTGFLPTYAAFDSGDVKNYNIGETIDWVPNKAIYVQVNGNIVFNTISTIYPRAGSTVAVYTTYTTSHATVLTGAPFNTNQILQNSNNNYVTGSALMGFVASKDDDVQFQYTYYKANNGNASLAAMTLPYGAAAEENVVTVGLKHKFNARMVMHAKVGYIDSKNDTTGGYTNFHGPLGYLSLEYAL